MPMIIWILVAAASLTSAYFATRAYGAWRWADATNALVSRLNEGRVAPGVARYTFAGLAGLPAPVKRYFSAVLTEGQPIVTAVSLTQSGVFNMSATSARWKPFTATQNFTTARPGFVWNAKIMMFPTVPVRVVDAFVGGEGLLRPTLLGLYELGTQQGNGEIARGELLRYFAESVWFPTALLPGQGVDWQAVDNTSATATITDGPISVTMLFRFDENDLIASIHVQGRAMTVGTTTVQMPWECRMSNYQMRGGMRVPLTGEVLYITPEGEKPYFQGTIETITYELAP